MHHWFRRLSLLLVLGALLLGACTSSDDDAVGGDDESVVDDTEPRAASIGVETTSLGDILVDTEGMTLYVTLNDTAGVPTCVDACAQAWPPFVADAVEPPAPFDTADFDQVPLSDGSFQIVYKGRPLYRFAGDSAPGETNGQGLNGVWYVVGLDGEPIRTPAAPS
jgi:predicted lipoprotein with Yx(FWY)xxD motif